jgi:hypothetical protein
MTLCDGMVRSKDHTAWQNRVMFHLPDVGRSGVTIPGEERRRRMKHKGIRITLVVIEEQENASKARHNKLGGVFF